MLFGNAMVQIQIVRMIKHTQTMKKICQLTHYIITFNSIESVEVI